MPTVPPHVEQYQPTLVLNLPNGRMQRHRSAIAATGALQVLVMADLKQLQLALGDQLP